MVQNKIEFMLRRHHPLTFAKSDVAIESGAIERTAIRELGAAADRCGRRADRPELVAQTRSEIGPPRRSRRPSRSGTIEPA